jgi:hypothetical protein
MTPETDRRRPVGDGAGVTEEVTAIVARHADTQDPQLLAELLDEAWRILTEAQVDPAQLPPEQWLVWSAGYAARGLHCCAGTYAQGRRDEGDEWTDTTAAAVAAARQCPKPDRTYRTKPKTAQQIAAAAAYSWRQIERAAEGQRAG